MTSMLARAGLDPFLMQHATHEPAALAAFGAACEAIAACGKDVLPALDRALSAAPDMLAADALKGICMLMSGRAEPMAAARALWPTLPRTAATADEAALCGALGAGLARGPLAAASVLEAHLLRKPELLLFIKLATALRFMGGDTRGMLAATAQVMPAWTIETPGFGYVLGCHAFALEEAGEYAAAERAGRRAVEIAPHDAWAVHAVAHVHEMTHRPAEGEAWIEAQRPGWRDCNSFTYHLSWHLALFHLDQGRTARVLELYDTEIRPDRSEEYRDFANAVAMLWRLRQHGVDVGGRWHELAGIARRRRAETGLVFASLHRLLALLAVGDIAAARDTQAALAAAAEGDDEQSGVAARVGAGLAAALVTTAESGTTAPLAGLSERLHLIGGSHAQRDVFVRSLALMAERHGDRATLAHLLSARRRLKRDDRFLDLLVA